MMPRLVVVDASVAVKWLIPEDYSDEALVLLRESSRGPGGGACSSADAG